MSNEKEWRVIIHPSPNGIPTLEIKKVSIGAKREIEQSTLRGVKIFPALFFWYPIVWISGFLARLFQSEEAYEIYQRAIKAMKG